MFDFSKAMKLKNHIDRWHDLQHMKKQVEEELKHESEWIMAELDDRGTDKFQTVKIISRKDERPNKALILTLFPDIWDKVKTTSESRFLRKCKMEG